MSSSACWSESNNEYRILYGVLDFYKLLVTGALLESQSRGWGCVILLLILHIVHSSQSRTRTDIYIYIYIYIYISWKKVLK